MPHRERLAFLIEQKSFRHETHLPIKPTTSHEHIVIPGRARAVEKRRE